MFLLLFASTAAVLAAAVIFAWYYSWWLSFVVGIVTVDVFVDRVVVAHVTLHFTLPTLKTRRQKLSGWYTTKIPTQTSSTYTSQLKHTAHASRTTKK